MFKKCRKRDWRVLPRIDKHEKFKAKLLISTRASDLLWICSMPNRICALVRCWSLSCGLKHVLVRWLRGRRHKKRFIIFHSSCIEAPPSWHPTTVDFIARHNVWGFVENANEEKICTVVSSQGWRSRSDSMFETHVFLRWFSFTIMVWSSFH